METTLENVSTEMKWYIVRSQSNRERSISEKIIKEGDRGDLMGKIGRVIVPSEKTFHMKNGKKVSREKVMYPGYIFVETNAVGELKYYLRGVNGATGFLTNRGGEIQALSNLEIDRMLGIQKAAAEKVDEEINFIPGEEVKVLEGPFSGFIGKIQSIRDQKVKVEVMIFGRTNLIELSILQIDKKRD